MRAARAYKSVSDSTSVMSNDSLGLVILLYERLLQRILETELAINVRDIESRSRASSAAIQIINEGLIGALDMEQGGDIAKKLRAHYLQWITLLMQCNMRGDATLLDTLRENVLELLSAWQQLKQLDRNEGVTVPK